MFSTEDELKAACREWATKVEQGIKVVEDRERLRKNLPPIRYTMSFMPAREDQLLALLNWRVWSERYKVDLDFILTFVFKFYGNHRKPSRDPRILSFGFPLPLVTGAACRKRLEEEIARQYPNGENYEAAKARRFHPVRKLDYEDVDGMNSRYDAVMRDRHKVPLRDNVPTRAFRKS